MKFHVAISSTRTVEVETHSATRAEEIVREIEDLDESVELEVIVVSDSKGEK